MNNPYNIYYDMQRNSFYRVNKATGDSARSYVNGENLPSFQPNVTGFVSHRRKSLSDTTYFFHSSSTNSPHHQTPRPHIIVKPNLTTLPEQGKGYKTKLLQAIKMETTMTNLKFSPNSTKYLRQNSPNTIKNELTEKIKLYQTIVEEKGSKNNSPRKDIDGSVDRKQKLDQLCITKNTIDHYDSESKTQKKQGLRRLSGRTQEKGLPDQYKIENQIKQQKKIYLTKIQRDERNDRNKSLERDLARKRNLKILEREMLKKNSNLERNIFVSDTQ